MAGQGTAFYFSMDCENPECGEEILEGLNLTLEEHNGFPVIPFDMAAQTDFECKACGWVHYTPSMDSVDAGPPED